MRVFILLIAATTLLNCTPSANYVKNITPDKAAPTCDAAKAHLVDIGCMQVPLCAQLVNDAVERYITPRIPKDARFEAYCDIALMTGILPVTCIMEAQTPDEVIECGKMIKVRNTTEDFSSGQFANTRLVRRSSLFYERASWSKMYRHSKRRNLRYLSCRAKLPLSASHRHRTVSTQIVI
jgi:hypothetical protein